MSAVLLDSDFGGQAIRALEQIEARCVIRIYHSGVIGNRDCVDFTSVKRKYIKCHATKITECYEVAVAVYGAGELCIHLLRDLEKAGVLCSGIFDRNDRLDEIAGVKISHDLESFLREIRGAEVIVVTAVFAYDEIEGLLKEKTDIKIMSLEEIVEGME